MSVKVWIPATIANFGAGFDVFGAAIEGLGDMIEIEPSDETIILVDGYEVPQDPEKNVAAVAARAFMRLVGEEQEFRMHIYKGIRPGSGLGSSGASSLGGAFAMARLLGIEDDAKIIKAATEGEKVASGMPHGDNVVPAYYGGFIILNSLEPLDVIKLPLDFELVIILPHVQIKTEYARKILPEAIPIGNAVLNVSNAASFIANIKEGNLRDACRYMEDYIAFPYRRILMPWFVAAKNAALEAGAYNLSVSGSGPALFAIGENLSDVGRAVKEVLEDMNIESEFFVTRLGGGVRCI